jgi:hypothetical protein
VSLGKSGMPLFGARVSDYSPATKTGAAWIMGGRYTFDMKDCLLAAGGHTDVHLTNVPDSREPKPRTVKDGPGESIVIYRTTGRAMAWGYRPEPELAELLSDVRLKAHVGCTFVLETYGWAQSWDDGRREYSAGTVVEATYEDGVLSVKYTSRDSSQELTQRIKIDATAGFEDLRGGGWDPVGRMIIEMEDPSAYNRVVLYER